jgi:TetR/AcrR family transcriptional regulator
MENREKLLDCATTLFAAKGYEGVGIQEIVDSAGVTKPTLYHYYVNKRGLLDAILKVNFNPFLERVRNASTYKRDIVRSLEQITQVYFQEAESDSKFFRLQLILQYAPPDSEPNQAVQPYRMEQQNIFQSLFIQSVQDHGNMQGRHVMMSATFLGMIHTYIGEYLNGTILLDDPLTFNAVHQYMHGIFS